MSRATPAQVDLARRLLAYEAAAGGGTAAAARVYDTLHAHLGPLVGYAGVELLFVRSAKMAHGEFAWLAESSILEGAAALRERLHAPQRGIAGEPAEALFATFFALLTTLIGDRLTAQVVRRAGPAIDEAPKGTEP